MRKAVFLLVAALTGYLSALYRQTSLLTLCVAALVLFTAMLVLSRVQLTRLSVVFSASNRAAAPQSADTDVTLHIRDSGRLPVGRFQVRLRYGYRRDGRRRTRMLYGSGRRGDGLSFTLRAPHCGLLELELDRLRVYDYLLLFAPKKRTQERLQLAVLPACPDAKITRAAAAWDVGEPAENAAFRLQADEPEMKQVREYRAGDAARFIHWNQSARSGGLWVKEYEAQGSPRAGLLLDTAADSPPDAAGWDAFYGLVSAIVRGLLGCTPAVCVYWYDSAAGQTAGAEVADESQCGALLAQLYRTEGGAPRAWADSFPTGPELLRLNTRLEWYRGNRLLYRFSRGALNSELTQQRFVV